MCITVSNIMTGWSRCSEGVERIISDSAYGTKMMNWISRQRVLTAEGFFIGLVLILVIDSLGGRDNDPILVTEKEKVYCCGPIPTAHDWECKQKEILAGGFMLCANDAVQTRRYQP